MRNGTTSDEVERLTGYSHQSVSARRTELRSWGYTDYMLDDKGRRIRRPTKSGKGAYVEIATAQGKNAIKLGLYIGDRADPTAGRHRGSPTSAAAFASSDMASIRKAVLKCMVDRTP